MSNANEWSEGPIINVKRRKCKMGPWQNSLNRRRDQIKKDEALILVNYYRRAIDDMQGHTFYREDEDGVLRRWYPSRRHSKDRKQ